MKYILLKDIPYFKTFETVDETNSFVDLILKTKDSELISNWIKPEPTEEDIAKEQLEFEQRELEMALFEKQKLERRLSEITQTISEKENVVNSLSTNEKESIIKIYKK